MILSEDEFRKFFFEMFGDDNDSKKFCEMLTELIDCYGKQYFRLGCQFVKEQLGTTDCLKLDENTATCLAEINKRLINEDDCSKIIEYYIQKVKEEGNDNKEEFSEKNNDN